MSWKNKKNKEKEKKSNSSYKKKNNRILNYEQSIQRYTQRASV